MRLMTQHATQNLRNYAKIVGMKQARQMMPLMAKALDINTQSVAAVLYLDKGYDNPHRDEWALCDCLVAIIRDGQVVTVMMSRKSQANCKHLRTQVII